MISNDEWDAMGEATGNLWNPSPRTERPNIDPLNNGFTAEYVNWINGPLTTNIRLALKAGNRIVLLENNPVVGFKKPTCERYNDPTTNVWDWKHIQKRATELVATNHELTGYGMIGGEISRNRFTLDFDQGDKLPAIAEAVKAETGVDLFTWAKVRSGRDKGVPGYHFIARTSENMKSENVAYDDTQKIICEFKADRMQVVGPGSRHQSGRLYEVEHGDPFDPPFVEKAEVEKVLAVIRTFDKRPPKPAREIKHRPAVEREYEYGTSPRELADRYNDEIGIEPALMSYGYIPTTGDFFQHPNNDSCNSVHIRSAVTAHHFGAGDPYGQYKNSTPYSLFVHFELGGDFSAGAKALAVRYRCEYKPLARTGLVTWESNTLDVLKAEAPPAPAPTPTPPTTTTTTKEKPANPFVVDSEKWHDFEKMFSRPAAPRLKIRSSKIMERLPEPPTIIDGLLRQGEIANVVSGPKLRKSWAMADLAFCASNGLKWLGAFQCEKTKVLLIDNELKEWQLQKRFETMRTARRLPESQETNFDFVSLREDGLVGIDKLEPMLIAEAQNYGLIILDALYRFFPANFDENSNSDFTKLYNTLDVIARKTGAAIVIVHHGSKGNQSAKSTTDSGSGAGAQSRAADAHIVLKAVIPKNKPQEDAPDCATLNAVVRSFAPVEAVNLEWQYPFYVPSKRDPTQFVTEAPARRRAAPPTTVSEFAKKFVTEHWESKVGVVERAMDGDVSRDRARDLINGAISEGHVSFREFKEGRKKVQQVRLNGIHDGFGNSLD